MGTNYYHVAAGLFLYFTGFSIAASQSGPEFLSCSNEPMRLCVGDDGVRLPGNNQVYLGENNAEATSCSVHISQKKRVKINCGSILEYRVELFLNDTSTAIPLQPTITIVTDSLQEAELSFDTEHSPDSALRANGIPYILECNSYHRIRWIVTDTCGQTDTCDQIIDLYDCHPPHLTNPPDIIFQLVIPLGCLLSLHAEDFIVGILDDCTAEDNFLLSLKEDTFLPHNHLDPCAVPAFGVEVPFDIWIADKGRDLDCNGAIEWSERKKYKQTVIVVYHDSGGACTDCFDEYFIRGKIETEDHRGVELVYVNLTAPGQVYPTYVTSDDGAYIFQGGHFNIPTTITPSRDDWHRNGVSTIDLVKIQKHLLGIEPFTSPYDVIAADANNSQNVSAIDLIELRKLILGRYTELPNSPSWKFVRKDYVFGDTMNPWPSPGAIENTNPEGSDNNDFIGIKIGDVNNTVQANFTAIEERSAYPIVKMNTVELEYTKGQVIDIPVYVSDGSEILGLQFTLLGDGLEFLNATSNVIPLGEEHYALYGDAMTMSWFELDPVYYSKDHPLLTIRAIANRNGRLQNTLYISSSITDAEFYKTDDETHTPVLTVGNDPQESIYVFPMQPNPWRESSVLPFMLKDESEISFTSYDASGRKVYAFEKLYPDGCHEITLSKEKFPQEGIYFYNLQSDQLTTSGKFVVLR